MFHLSIPPLMGTSVVSNSPLPQTHLLEHPWVKLSLGYKSRGRIVVTWVSATQTFSHARDSPSDLVRRQILTQKVWNETEFPFLTFPLLGGEPQRTCSFVCFSARSHSRMAAPVDIPRTCPEQRPHPHGIHWRGVDLSSSPNIRQQPKALCPTVSE